MVSDTSFGWDGDYQSLYLSNEDGTWVYSTFSNVKVKPVFASSAVGDIDSDGDIDVVLTIKGKGLNCMYNDGFGILFKNATMEISPTQSLGDIDRDGDLDAYVGANSYKGKGGLGQYGGASSFSRTTVRGNFLLNNVCPKLIVG